LAASKVTAVAAARTLPTTCSSIATARLPWSRPSWGKPLTEGLAQAIYGVDMNPGEEGEVASFPAPDELWNLTFAEENAWRDRFADVPFEDRGGFFQGTLLPGRRHRARAGSRGGRTRFEFKQIIGRGARLYRWQELLHDLQLREGAPPFQRSGMGWRARGRNGLC
jgi:hypothetical protein